MINKGDKVRIIGSAEEEKYKECVFEVLSEPYNICGSMVVKMKCHETGKYFGGDILKNIELLYKMNSDAVYKKIAGSNLRKAELELAKAFHKEAVAERDLLNIQLKEANAEIESLKNHTDFLMSELNKVKEKLYGITGKWDGTLGGIDKVVNEVGVKAVKKFAERFKQRFESDSKYSGALIFTNVDVLVEETVGEG